MKTSARGMWACGLTLLLFAAIDSVGISVVRAAGQAPGTPGISFTRTVYPIFEAAQCRGSRDQYQPQRGVLAQPICRAR